MKNTYLRGIKWPKFPEFYFGYSWTDYTEVWTTGTKILITNC